MPLFSKVRINVPCGYDCSLVKTERLQHSLRVVPRMQHAQGVVPATQPDSFACGALDKVEHVLFCDWNQRGHQFSSLLFRQAFHVHVFGIVLQLELNGRAGGNDEILCGVPGGGVLRA